MKNTDRNVRIIEMRRAGMWPREIAAQLGITKNVVIGVTNRAGLSKWGQQIAGLHAAYEAGAVNTPRGERHCRARLDDDTVREIRARYTPRHRHDSAAQIARELRVSKTVVSQAAAGKTWAHVQ